MASVTVNDFLMLTNAVSKKILLKNPHLRLITSSIPRFDQSKNLKTSLKRTQIAQRKDCDRKECKVFKP